MKGPMPLGSMIVISRRMSFFWANGSMSWMRYLTLKSFRYFHPDWEMVLYTTDLPTRSDVFSVGDYWSHVSELNIHVKNWIPPTGYSKMSPAQSSDLCEWQALKQGDGFFSDMDILYVRPLPYSQVRDSDVVYCFSRDFATIGFFGASANNSIFSIILRSAYDNYSPTRYQSLGAEAIYRTAGLGERWFTTPRPGALAMRKLCRGFPNLKVTSLSGECFYPWYYEESTKCIFESQEKVPENCVGIHWFGGLPSIAQYEKNMTKSNRLDFPCTFTYYAEKIIDD